MKILVLDDNPIHRELAEIQLAADHDLTVVGSYDEARDLLDPNYFGQKVCGETSPKVDYDVVMVDLLLPASGKEQGNSSLVGQEMPLGIFLGLLAMVHPRIKNVAVFTDSDHHEHPASACFDAFSAHETDPLPLKVGEGQLFLVNNRNWISHYHQDNLHAKWTDFSGPLPLEVVPGKSWISVLDYMLNYA